jgi:hypothetical protein
MFEHTVTLLNISLLINMIENINLCHWGFTFGDMMVYLSSVINTWCDTHERQIFNCREFFPPCKYWSFTTLACIMLIVGVFICLFLVWGSFHQKGSVHTKYKLKYFSCVLAFMIATYTCLPSSRLLSSSVRSTLALSNEYITPSCTINRNVPFEAEWWGNLFISCHLKCWRMIWQ